MKKLQKQLIFSVFLSVLMVFLLVLGVVDLAISLYIRDQADDMTELIQNNGGVIPDTEEYKIYFSQKNYYKTIDIDEDTAYRTRYFLVHLNEDNTINETELSHIASVDQNVAMNMTKQVLANGSNNGYINNYYYVVRDDTLDLTSDDNSEENVAANSEAGDSSVNSSTDAKETDTSANTITNNNHKVIIFLDCSRELRFKETVLFMTAVIFAALVVIVTIIFALISGKILRPFERNAQKQKQFITDASHELKTPLAIIQANADVLRYKDGESDWLNNITDQTKQMSKLIGDLLALTKADEVADNFVKEEVDLVRLLSETWEPFTETAAIRNITMEKDVPAELPLNCNKEMISRLLTVLTDNAVKYTCENGRILLTMSANKKNVMIKSFNTAEIKGDFDCRHLFERFYRPDSSRSSSTGGHGIGLSIAKKIVDNHHGKITAERVKDGICFTVILPNNGKNKG